jgi:hypothetical protein
LGVLAQVQVQGVAAADGCRVPRRTPAAVDVHRGFRLRVQAGRPRDLAQEDKPILPVSSTRNAPRRECFCRRSDPDSAQKGSVEDQGDRRPPVVEAAESASDPAEDADHRP